MGASQCDSCLGANRLPASQCACPANGFFDAFNISDVASYDCQPCANQRCATCSSTSAAVCESCYGQHRLTAQQCACPATGYFDAFVAGNTSTYDCVSCISAKCLTCSTSATKCDSCAGLGRDPSALCECPPLGFYDAFNVTNPSTNDCVPCANEICDKCSSVSA